MFESVYPPCSNNFSEDGNSSTNSVNIVKNFNVAFLLTSTLGLIFNAVSIAVLMVPKTLSSYSSLLISLCVSDSVQLLYHWIFCGLSVFDIDFDVGWPRFQRVASFMMDVGKCYAMFELIPKPNEMRC